MRDIDGRLQDAVIKRDTLRQELVNAPAMLVAEDDTRLQGQIRTKLQEAEEQLRMLQLKDTEQHPDVIAQKKMIAALKRSREGCRAGKRRRRQGRRRRKRRQALGVQPGL